METRRSLRVADAVLHEVADIIQREVKDPRIGFVTFTSAHVSPDLHYARVYYTVLGDRSALEQTKKGLESASPFVRRELGRRLRLKVIPELRFEYDEALERELRLQGILKDIGHEQEEPDR
ncbi:MAG: 30S ribosome-binding factor RbfA [Deltaproteobacteria bacterium]|nr:30S ribosome-binding factor RbfA [Deltaproteobacteria bacterium]